MTKEDLYELFLLERELVETEADFIADLRKAAPDLIAAARELERLKPLLVEWALARRAWIERSSEGHGRMYTQAENALLNAIPVEWLEDK